MNPAFHTVITASDAERREALLPALFDVVTPVLADLLQNEQNLLKLDEKRAYRLLEAKLAARKANA